jgi:murein DD-endopeptidase MepM/ murein hydrolase activator NlpD
MSFFGDRVDPFSGLDAFHSGVDISAPIGTPVRVTADGVVSSAGSMSGYGRVVVINHPSGLQTYYAHLSRFLVFPGQEVRMGEVIAFSGATGRVTTPHLHYEVRLRGSPVNPYKFLRVAGFASSPRREIPF